MSNRNDVIQAIRDSWSAESSEHFEEWTPDNPAFGQCDVSSLIAWEYLGGELVLSQVFVNGEMTEHHYWNRVDGLDLDLTREQFTGNEDIRVKSVLTSEQLRNNQDSMRPEFVVRLELFRRAVADRLAHPI